jgi:hypothetical protein
MVWVKLDSIFYKINYHPQSGWFECAPQRGAFV